MTLTDDQKKKAKSLHRKFEREYQNWYTESSSVIRQLLPSRLAEFESLYKGDGKRRGIDGSSYTIQDWLNGVRAAESLTQNKTFNDSACVTNRFNNQTNILGSAAARLESSLFDIKQLVQADLFDSELDAARGLVKHGFGRGAGAIAGVVLERHLNDVATNHKIVISKKRPTINDYNEALKAGDVVDIPTFRSIQWLADIRNLCDHSSTREPSTDEINGLINGVDKVSKTVF